MVELTLPLFGLLFAAGIAAGFVDSIAGGGGLITLPTLLWAGLPPAHSLATNKLQSSFGSLSATYHYARGGHVDSKTFLVPVLCTFVGAVSGSATVQHLDSPFLANLLPLLLVGIALYVLFSPRVGDYDARQRVGVVTFGLTAGFGIGFYDGFFGPGTGSFFSVACVVLLGFNLTRATAHAKLLNFTSNFASLLAFLVGGKVLWGVGLAMGAGQVLGARLGSRLVMRAGARVVRPVLVTASLLITLRLVWGDPDHLLRQGWRMFWDLLG